MGTVLAVPVDLGREEAQEAAAEELSKVVYQESQPGLTERAVFWLLDRISDLLDRVSEASPGGVPGLFLIVVLVVAAAVALRLTTGPLRRAARAEDALFVGGPRSAAEHRAAAVGHAADGRWDEAVRERLRAVIRGLEERSLLDPRPGRTADEAATEAGQALPEQAGPLRSAARIFDDIWYGGRPATPQAYEALRELDEQVGRSRPVLSSRPG